MMNKKNSIFRLLDANLNRAVEGLRVLEETARMILDDSYLTVKFKETRHRLTGLIKNNRNLEFNLISERGSDHDLLRSEESGTEKKRSGLMSILRANSSRACEALRALEEYIKLIDPSLSIEFKKIRFELYDLEKALFLKIHKRYLFNDGKPKLGVMLNRDSILKGIRDVVEGCTENGADIIIYASSGLSDKNFMDEAIMLKALCDSQTLFMVKSRLDAALISEADGICLENGDADISMCRKTAGENFCIAKITDSEETDSGEAEDSPDMIFIRNGLVKPSNGSIYDMNKTNNIPYLFYCSREPDIAEIINWGGNGLIIEPDFIEQEKTFKLINRIRKELKESETYANPDTCLNTSGEKAVD